MTNPKPTTRRPGRPFNTSTPLGHLMRDRGYGVNTLSFATGINQRTFSDYLAGRRAIRARHLAILCDLFDVSRDAVTGSAAVPADDRRAVAPMTRDELQPVMVQWLKQRKARGAGAEDSG